MSIVIDYTKGFFEASPTGETVGDISGNATLDLSSGNVFNHTPTADTTFVFSNPPASGTAYGMTLKITGANLGTGYDLASASYDSKSFSVTSQEALPIGIFFKPDGTKAFISGVVSDSVFEYDLSTAWDISTASYNSVTFSAASQDASVAGLFFKPDGTKMYIVGYTGDSVYQYTLSTAWDLSTASYDSVSFSVNAQETVPLCLAFSSDGTRLYVAGSTGDDVNEYSLSTAWDVSTASYTQNFSVASQITAPYGMAFNQDGTIMFIAGVNESAVFQYNLSTAWDVSSASYASISFSTSTQDAQPLGVFFGSNGTKMYIAGNTNDSIFQYTTGSSGPATFTYPASVDWPGGTAPDAPADGETDVLSFYTTDGGTTYYGFQVGDALA